MKVDFTKNDGLVPVIIQNYVTKQVLMLGYMNEQALEKTRKDNVVTFYSRSKKRLWTKGEESGNFLIVKNIFIDCDNDTILIKAEPKGDTCHKGNISCFADDTSTGFLYELEKIISEKTDSDDSSSYTNELYKRGINKIAQKVGEEAVEVVIEAKDNDRGLFENEVSDLLYHLLILLKYKDVSLGDIERVLRKRNE